MSDSSSNVDEAIYSEEDAERMSDADSENSVEETAIPEEEKPSTSVPPSQLAKKLGNLVLRATASKAVEGDTPTLLKPKEMIRKRISLKTNQRRSVVASARARKIPLSTMLVSALQDLDKRKGCSLFSVKTYLKNNFDYNTTANSKKINSELKKMMDAGSITQISGKSLAGSFRFVKKPAKKVIPPVKEAEEAELEDDPEVHEKTTTKGKGKEVVKARVPKSPETKDVKGSKDTAIKGKGKSAASKTEKRPKKENITSTETEKVASTKDIIRERILRKKEAERSLIKPETADEVAKGKKKPTATKSKTKKDSTKRAGPSKRI